MIGFHTQPGSTNCIELHENGCIVLGPAYDRETLARALARQLPLPFQISRNGMVLVEIDTYGFVHFHSGDFAKNSEMRAFLGRVAELKLERAPVVQGRSVQ